MHRAQLVVDGARSLRFPDLVAASPTRLSRHLPIDTRLARAAPSEGRPHRRSDRSTHWRNAPTRCVSNRDPVFGVRRRVVPVAALCSVDGSLCTTTSHARLSAGFRSSRASLDGVLARHRLSHTPRGATPAKFDVSRPPRPHEQRGTSGSWKVSGSSNYLRGIVNSR